MNYNIFEKGWDHKNAYAFGLIMSDGCLIKKKRNKYPYVIRITSNDINTLKQIHEYMRLENKIYKCGSRCYQVEYRNEEAIDFMLNNYLEQRKSLTLRFPDIPKEFFWDFVRGFFDGDGSVVLTENKYNVYGQVSITCGSITFLQSLELVLSKEKIKSHIYKEKRNKNNLYYLKIIKRKEIEKFFSMMYKDAEDSYFFSRKKEKFEKLMSHKEKYNTQYDIV